MVTKEEAVEILRKNIDWKTTNQGIALLMGAQAIEKLGHLTDRPCEVCEFRTKEGCSEWECVFD